MAPDVPGGTRVRLVTRKVCRPQALPISLATVSLAPATSAAVSASSARSRWGEAAATAAATAARPVLARALPGPRRPPRSSAMPSRTFRRSPSRVVTVATRNAESSRVQPCQPAAVNTIVPMVQPASAPGHVTVRARQPAAATTALSAMAGPACRTSAGSCASSAGADSRLSVQSVPAAAAGTLRLSSRRTGIVSTSAAAAAAASGAAVR